MKKMIRWKIIIPCWLLIFPIFIVPLIAQTIETSEGYLDVYILGNIYTLTPICCPDSAMITPMLLGSEEGSPMQFIIHGSSNQQVTVSFALPDTFSKNGCYPFLCKFDSTSLLYKETGRYYNPNSAIVLRLSEQGIASLALGISILYPTMSHSEPVYVTVRDSANTVIASDSSMYSVGITMEGPPSFIHDIILNGFERGHTYRLKPASDHLVVTPSISGKEEVNGDFLYELSTDCNSKVELNMELPAFLVNQDNMSDTVFCSFTNEDGLDVRQQTVFDPHQSYIFHCGSEGNLKFMLGINFSIPYTSSPGTYAGSVLLDMFYIGLQEKQKLTRAATDLMTFGLKVEEFPTPKGFHLYQNYPNPFNPSTVIQYSLPGAETYGNTSQHVSLKIYNMLGEEIATLVDGAQQVGEHSVTWNAGNFPSGVYYYRITTSSYTDTKKLILLR